VDASKLADLFDPARFMVKITPIHNNNACRDNNIATIGGYDSYLSYSEPEARLKEAGFDVLVFVPSMDEEDGLVTCGNAVLGGGELRTGPDDVVNIAGLDRTVRL
jgi:23S rRNA (adenine2503-C2)-methyltransferase